MNYGADNLTIFYIHEIYITKQNMGNNSDSSY